MATLSQFSSGGRIKRIQRGTITIPTSTTGAVVSLAFPVDSNKSVLTLLGTNTSNVVASGGAQWNRTAAIQITGGGTTLTASGAEGPGRGYVVPDPLTLTYQIVEYY